MSDGKISPLAPSTYPEIPPIEGVRLATEAAGIKYRDRTDLLFVRFDPSATIAGVFTRSQCASAPVDWCRANLARGTARALVVNSGNANAFTGMKGAQATRATAEAAGEALECDPGAVFLSSTGVIGEPLDPEPFERHLENLARKAEPGGFLDAAKAIMTTDTFPKVATRTVEMNGAIVTLNGIAKGSGMIAPDMATMLAFIFTDAALSQAALQRALEAAVAGSFNAITVDSDTSTSDTVMLFATGAAEQNNEHEEPDQDSTGYAEFRLALDDLCRDLAIQIVRDGEGASKFISIKVSGAVSDSSAAVIARSIANSPLVKTAIAGSDANWGRIVMAVGKAGEPADRDLLSIWFGDHRVALSGGRDPAYSEDAVSAYMANEDIEIAVDLGLGSGAAQVWTCDLTHDYIAINADYRS